MTWLRRATWPGLIFVLLGIGFLTTGHLVFSALGDPSFAVEDDYYQRGQSWDERMAEERISAALGWQVECVLRPGAAQGDAVVALVVRDREGLPINGLGGEVTGFPVARSGQQHRAAIVAGEAPGEYVAVLQGARLGLWDLRVKLSRGNQQYVTNVRREWSARP